MRGNTATMPTPVQTADAAALTEPDGSRTQAVIPELQALVPWPGGIRRGATVAAVGSLSLVLALLGGAMASGSWAAVAGIPELGALAAAEHRIPLERLAMIPAPGPDWPTAVAALIDGIDLVVVRTPPAGVSDAIARSLMARARQRGCVLIPAGVGWPGGDLTIEMVDRSWSGLELGRGRLREQTVTLRAMVKGRAAQPRTLTTTLPPRSLGHNP